MNRRSVAWISAAMCCSLSCAFVVPPPAPRPAPTPQPVALVPPENATEPPPRPPAHVETPVDTPEIAAVRAELERRRTGLDDRAGGPAAGAAGEPADRRIPE